MLLGVISCCSLSLPSPDSGLSPVFRDRVAVVQYEKRFLYGRHWGRYAATKARKLRRKTRG